MPKPKLYTSKKWLFARYIKDRMTEQEIAILAGTDQSTINRWLHRLGLKK